MGPTNNVTLSIKHKKAMSINSIFMGHSNGDIKKYAIKLVFFMGPPVNYRISKN